MSEDFEDDYWRDLSGSRTVHEAIPLLIFETFEDIQPLDTQFGVFPAAFVPEALQEPLFGSGPFDDDHMLTYIIVSTEQFGHQADEIEGCGLPYKCLFKGEAALERRDEAPYIIQLDRNEDFTKRIFTYDAKAPRELTSHHLWHTGPGLFVRSTGSLEMLCQHFRMFTRTKDQNGKWIHFRFWDGEIFPEYWRYFSASHERVTRFFHARDGSFSCDLFYVSGSNVTRIRSKQDLLADHSRPRTAFALTEEDHAFFQDYTDTRFRQDIKARLYEKLAAAPSDQIQRISDVVDQSFIYIKAHSRGGLVLSQDCETLALLVLMWGDLAPKILKGPIFSDPLVDISKKIALAKTSHFDMLSKIRGMKE